MITFLGFSSVPFLNLPRTTERPVRKRGDECSDLPVRAAPQSHERKSVVRGLPTCASRKDRATDQLDRS